MVAPVRTQNRILIYAPVMKVSQVPIAKLWTIPAPPHLVFMVEHAWNQQGVHSLANVHQDGLAPLAILVSLKAHSILSGIAGLLDPFN